MYLTRVKEKNKESFIYRLIFDMQRNWILYLMVIPVIIYFILFHYWPMYGITLAFKEYNAKSGIVGSPWIGLNHFNRFFLGYNFSTLIKNTLGISLYGLLVGFPIPIIFALLLNYLRNNRLRKIIQMVSYAPHFISTVVICSMITIFLAPRTGVFNIIRGLFGLQSLDFLGIPSLFKSIYVWSGVWQGTGWSAIIYISALAGVDYQLHEAAIMDGASKIQRMVHVDIPSIVPTIIMLLILRLGSMMNVGFEKVYLLQNSLNKPASSTISTYVYEIGLIKSNYGFSTAVGLFNTIINVFLLVGSNILCKSVLNESLF